MIDDNGNPIVQISTDDVFNPEYVMSKIGPVLLQNVYVRIHTATSKFVIQALRSTLEREFSIHIKNVSGISLLVQGFRKKSREGKPLMQVAEKAETSTATTSTASRISKPLKKKLDRVSETTGIRARVFGRTGCTIKLVNKRILEHSYGVETKPEIEERIDQIEQLMSSKIKFSKQDWNNFIGAIGELKTIQALLDLGEQYSIFNNVQLGFEPGFRIGNGERRDWVKSQQIDHVVVGPKGIFVIESKNWGHETITESLQSKGYNPIKQAIRCKKALTRFLKESMKTKSPYVKAVVALSGKALFSGNRHVKVLAVDGLCNHIQSLNKSVTPELVRRVTSIISSRRSDEESLWVSTRRKSRRKWYK